MQHKFCVAIDTQIATKSPFRCNSTPPIATELVVLPKGFVAIEGKPCSDRTQWELNIINDVAALKLFGRTTAAELI
jgi:hypothetical protein